MRRADLLKPCKLSPIDHAVLDHLHAYTETAGAMFATTHTPVAERSRSGVNVAGHR